MEEQPSMAYHKAVLKAEVKGSETRHRKSREEEKKRKAEKRRNNIPLKGEICVQTVIGINQTDANAPNP